MHRTLLGLLALLPLAPTAGELAPRYYAHARLRVETRLAIESEIVAFEMERDGEPLEGWDGPVGSVAALTQETVIEDEVLAQEDGRPTELRRTFTTLERTLSADGEDEAQEAPLEGVTARLTLGADDELAVAIEEGSADASLLEGQRLAVCLDELLAGAGAAVEPGDAWTIDSRAIAAALGLDVDARLFPPAEEERGAGEGRRGRGGFGTRRAARLVERLARMEWEGQARLLEGEEVVDGHACRTIALEITGSASYTEPWRGRGGFALLPPVTLDNECEIELEGTLHFSVEARRVVSLELEGELTLESVRERGRDGSRMRVHSEERGSYRHAVRVSGEKDE